LAGEIVWVTIYLGREYAFKGNIVALADLMGNASGTIVAVGGASFPGYKVVKPLRNIQAKQRQISCD